MINIESETLLSPSQAAKHVAIRNADGRPAHIAKVYRLFEHGTLAADGTRVKLEYVVVPGGRRTSAEAIERLVARLTNSSRGAASAPAYTTAARRRQAARVDADLDAAGIR